MKVILACLAGLLLTALSLAAETWYIPAAANTAGAYGTDWRTEAVFVNPGDSTVCADLFLQEAGKDNAAAEAHPLEVPAGHSITLNDLVGTFFASPGKAGAVRVEADGFLVITSRTYNDLGDEGTYGQGVPGLSPGSLLRHGESRLIYPFRSGSAFRTNLGLVNAGPDPVRVDAGFYDALHPYPAALGGGEWDLPPYGYLQENSILERWPGASGDTAYAVLSVATPGGTVLPWVSGVDNRTGDPVFTPAAETSDLTPPAEKEWIRAMGWSGDDLAHAVAAGGDGGMWVAGETASTGTGSVDAWLFQVDRYGRPASMGILEGPGQDKIFGLQILADGGAVLCGASTTAGSEVWYAWAVALDGTGQVRWSRWFSRPESAWLYAILPMPDGTFRACGQMIPGDGTPEDAWILAFEADGAILWQKRLRGSRLDWLYALAPADDGGLVAAGATQSFGGADYDAWLVRLDATGAVLWERVYGGTGQDVAYAIARRPGGGWAVAGQTDSWGDGGGDQWLFSVDADGSFQWGRTLGTLDADVAYALATAPDGRLLTAGQKGAITAGRGDAWVAEWDGSGALLQQASFGGAQPERVYGASARPDGGWLAAGRTESAGAGGKDLLLLSLPPGLGPAAPCPFRSSTERVPRETPPVGLAVGSLVLDDASVPLPWMEPGPAPVKPEDEVLCGRAHDAVFRALLPAAARTGGAYGTRWRTDLSVRFPYDRWASDGVLRLSFLPSGRDNPEPATVEVHAQPGALVLIDDVLDRFTGEEPVFGALALEADGPVEAWSVTYTRDPDGGTHGQSIPAFAGEACLRNGDAALLAGLKRVPEYRTNIGFAGPGPDAAEIAVEVFAADGELMGARSFHLPASGHLQTGDFLGEFGERVEGAYAVVRASGDGACLFAYASVADNRTGDPVYIPAVRLP